MRFRLLVLLYGSFVATLIPTGMGNHGFSANSPLVVSLGSCAVPIGPDGGIRSSPQPSLSSAPPSILAFSIVNTATSLEGGYRNATVRVLGVGTGVNGASEAGLVLISERNLTMIPPHDTVLLTALIPVNSESFTGGIIRVVTHTPTTDVTSDTDFVCMFHSPTMGAFEKTTNIPPKVVFTINRPWGSLEGHGDHLSTNSWVFIAVTIALSLGAVIGTTIVTWKRAWK